MSSTVGFSASAAAKDLERRWGLTLVSFLPVESAGPLLRVRERLRQLVEGADEPVAEFYDAEQMHCTHLTLTRSSAWGPVRAADFVKAGIDPQLLCEILARETAGLGSITVTLDRLELSDNGFQLRGRCADEDSTGRRHRLLERLNAQLPRCFNLGRRAWDTDPARHAFVHMRLGFMKRPRPGYETLVAETATLPLDPITLSFDEVTLVHHRYRSLRGPHAGAARFPLSGGAAPPVAALNLL